MPYTQNTFLGLKSPVLQNAVKVALINYATYVQKNVTAVTSPTAGYKAYDKQVALAKQVIQNPDLYVEAATRLVLINEHDIEFNLNATAGYLLGGNVSGDSVFKCIASNGGGPGNGWAITSTPGDTLWDVLAGVNLSDFV